MFSFETPYHNNAHVSEGFSPASDAGSHFMPMVVVILARAIHDAAHDCQARLHLQLRHLLWLRLSHPITVWDCYRYYETADTRLCTYARM
jgi:hypothetical protein